MPKTDDLTVEKLMADPAKYGFPTFAQFCRTPEKWRPDTEDDRLARVDRSTQTFKAIVSKQVYRVAGYDVATLEEAQRIARNEGVDLSKCKLCPLVVPEPGGKCKIVVEFLPKTESKILNANGTPFYK